LIASFLGEAGGWPEKAGFYADSIASSSQTTLALLLASAATSSWSA
jgi:hypothetical protein